MFSLRLTTKRELIQTAALLDELRKERDRAILERDHERRRSEGLLQMLLAKTQGMVLKPEDLKPATDLEEQQQKMLNIFDEDGVTDLQKKAMMGESPL